VRLINEAARAAGASPTEAEKRLRDAERVVYRTTRREASATTFGLFGRVLGTIIALAPGTALAVHAWFNRTEPATLVEVVLGVVPAFAIAALMLKDLWKQAKKPERVLVESKLG
jgi:hypothetical protein